MSIYHRAPYPLKVAVAGLRGRRLNATRYPAHAEVLVDEALARDHFTGDQWQSWQQDRVRVILDRARRLVPHYRDHGAEDDLSQWPVLEKAPVRADPDRFLCDDRRDTKLHKNTTSGTSGAPIVMSRTSDDVARHYAIYEARARRWNGVSRHDNWAILGGQLVTPFDREAPPFWVHSKPLNQLYLSTQHIKPANAEAFASELCRFAPTHLVGYPSSMTLLARLCLEQGHRLPAPKVLISNAEPLSDEQRTDLAAAFGCPTRDTYGMGEGAASAAECASGSLHISPDNGVVEVLGDDGSPVPPGVVGDVVVTGLTNESMLLVRYRTGDRAALSAAPCACGLAAPVIERIEGRVSDMIVTPDGRRVFWLNPIYAGLPLREAQIVQPSATHLDIRLVPTSEWSPAAEATLRERLRERVGDMAVETHLVDHIERGPNGKFRPVISNVES